MRKLALEVRRYLPLLAVLVLTVASYSFGQSWHIELHTGNSFKLPNDLKIVQAGQEEVIIRGARYETRPWSNTSSLLGLTENYYSLRVGYSPDDTWIYELEVLHDKVYYTSGKDPYGVVQHFELTDGLNSVLGNIAYSQSVSPAVDVVLRAGFGLAVVNPATVIRDKPNGTRTYMGDDSAYHLAGFSGQVGVQLRYYVVPSFGLTGEAKYLTSFVNSPISDGFALAWFQGMHLVFGVVFRI